MKKMLLVALLVLLPLSVYALEPMADGGLDEITAQEGVRITIGGDSADDALIITQQAVDTAWENDQSGVKSSILMDVTGGKDEIKIWGSLTIQAKQVELTDGSTTVTKDAVVIGLPQITRETVVAKSTVISIGGECTASTTDKTITQANQQVLGTLFQAGGMTEINTADGSNGVITISALD
ncbi:hypothetical protein DSLASN_16930 [Desulfoluna limicola]|uniref:Uncharacterized protein n=2 Tax=Desulfoluna limicola TaxID=2810562 RepID=A0ABM7PFX4_9BACT|nr:hypothetical protein DSLASN_16930 [Desulfoluna limicola]